MRDYSKGRVEPVEHIDYRLFPTGAELWLLMWLPIKMLWVVALEWQEALVAGLFPAIIADDGSRYDSQNSEDGSAA